MALYRTLSLGLIFGKEDTEAEFCVLVYYVTFFGGQSYEILVHDYFVTLLGLGELKNIFFLEVRVKPLFSLIIFDSGLSLA